MDWINLAEDRDK